MPLELIYSGAAERDFRDLFNSIAVDKPLAARTYLQTVRATCEMLSEMPFAGPEVFPPAGGLRLFVHRRRVVILYRPNRKGLLIVRALHHSRDVQAVIRSLRR